LTRPSTRIRMGRVWKNRLRENKLGLKSWGGMGQSAKK
jgi:hypothetical protein